MKLDALVSQIQNIDAGLKTAAGKAVNRMVTIRNWLIGYYIVHYEQRGEDRAKYGDDLLPQLAKRLAVKGLNASMLSRCRQFAQLYPQILATVSQEFAGQESSNQILLTLSGKFGPEEQGGSNRRSLTAISDDVEILGSSTQELMFKTEGNQTGQTPFVQSGEAPMVPPNKLISSLSFSHLVELLPITDPLKRTFYEVEAIKGTWSVRELRRQIGSLYFERSGLSADPARLSAITQGKTAPQKPEDIVKSVYTFEFLGLPTHLAVEEEHLETALLDHIQEFILELGEGFCFEARQKRILIGDEYFFIDLVFYHRILKCHVLIDLKVEAFTHHMAGQLNTYLNYYKKEVVPEGDNPPIGILLVTDKNTALVEYATAGMDEGMFVKKYLLQLPKPEVLQAFILDEIKKW